MIAADLFQKIEKIIPLEMALKKDIVGFIGPGNPEEISVDKILVLMDYIPQYELKSFSNNLNPPINYNINYKDYDLLITHHPPIIEPEIPTYVIHSNWDVISGGACDALANKLEMEINDILDPETGLGRIVSPLNGPISLDNLKNLIKEKLNVDCIKCVLSPEFSKNPEKTFSKIAIVSGFGLNPDFIKIAHERGAEVYISGDLTHPGAILAKVLGINLIDVNHHTIEMPGLYALTKLIRDFGVKVEVFDTGIPWNMEF